MRLRGFFSRSRETAKELTSENSSAKEEKEVLCDTSELKRVITLWTNNEGWEFKDFATFAKLIGVQTPIKLSDWNKEKCSFKCVTALNTEVTIYICPGDFEELSELWVTEGEETRRYFTNRTYEKGRFVPKVTLYGRNITRNGKELISYYCRYFSLKLDDTHMLKVEINNLNKKPQNDEEYLLSLDSSNENCQQVEEYLLSLDDSSLVLAQVYGKVMELLGFSNEGISDSKEILVSYTETVGNKK